jgi:[ribosomal protein S5]-alanine N-acetyltransferase
MATEITFTTERLLLKGISPQVIHHLFMNKTKDEIISYFGFDETGFLHLKNMFDKGMESYSISLFYFLLIDKQTNLPLGECGFHSWNKKHNKADAFYLLRHDDNKQKGLMSEAFPIVLKYGFEEMNLHRIAATIADWNTASKRLLLKNNFKKEGTLREDYFLDGSNHDSDCYSLLKWEWNELNN